jgi:hypothetical protein
MRRRRSRMRQRSLRPCGPLRSGRDPSITCRCGPGSLHGSRGLCQRRNSLATLLQMYLAIGTRDSVGDAFRRRGLLGACVCLCRKRDGFSDSASRTAVSGCGPTVREVDSCPACPSGQIQTLTPELRQTVAELVPLSLVGGSQYLSYPVSNDHLLTAFQIVRENTETLPRRAELCHIARLDRGRSFP